MLLDNVAALVNLGMRRTGLVPGTEDERDPEQVRLSIEAIRALLPLLEQAAPAQVGPIREAVSQLQIAYVKIGGQPAGSAGSAGQGAGAGGAGGPGAGGPGAGGEPAAPSPGGPAPPGSAPPQPEPPKPGRARARAAQRAALDTRAVALGPARPGLGTAARDQRPRVATSAWEETVSMQ